MKIDSNTLYQQWRNLTLLFPTRCDPSWIDLEVSMIEDSEISDHIQQSQLQQGKSVPCGYESFIEDMYSLTQEENIKLIPKVGAPFISLKYQTLDEPYLFDYLMVPKLSVVDPLYMSAGPNSPVIAKSGRFTLKDMQNGGDLSEVAKRRRTESESARYDRMLAYDTEIPLPTDSPALKQRHRTPELEWIGVNLLANYTFNKDSVQLIYFPVHESTLDVSLGQLPSERRKKRSAKAAMPTVRQTDKDRLNKASLGKSYRRSQAIKVTANNLLIDGFGDPQLAILQNISDADELPEHGTDLTSGRRMVNNESIARVRQQREEEDDDVGFDPKLNILFYGLTPTNYRNPDPNHISRAGDSNKNYLSFNEGYRTLLDEWYVKIFDPMEDRLVLKTARQWQVECALDGVPLMPFSRASECFKRGMSTDQILFLSQSIVDSTPDDQFYEMLDKFVTEELTLR